MGRVCSTHWRKKKAYRILLRKSQGKSLLKRPRRRWEDNNQMNFREIEWDGME
jgi:hypothetical protein